MTKGAGVTREWCGNDKRRALKMTDDLQLFPPKEKFAVGIGE
jgi:hypothetical protein